MPPAMRFMRRACGWDRGIRRAKANWEILPIAPTGLMSVSPTDWTAIMLKSMARRIARRRVQTGMKGPRVNLTDTMQKVIERRRARRVIWKGIREE
jgi:hypothetical protein